MRLFRFPDVSREAGSLLITSQVPVDRWYDIIANPTLANAVLDRVVHNAYRIELSGERLRKSKASEPVMIGRMNLMGAATRTLLP